MARDYSGPSKWIPGVVLKKLGPVTYDVEISNGRTIKRHVDQLRLRKDNTEDPPSTKVDLSDSSVLDNHHYPPSSDDTISKEGQTATEPDRRYPLRTRRPPDCFTPNSGGQSHS